MPDKYHIQTRATPGKFRRVGQFASIDWREDCARCTNCVKNRCVYEVYRHEAASNADPQAPMQTLYECKACFSCVQGCTKGLLSIGVNPEYLALGDGYWKPSIIATTWNQAETGRIPVSGAGYRGPFSGPGFDSIWTDMSEIVRPTRDGIHGREYISTMVDIGPKPMRLSFSESGSLDQPGAALIEVQMPAILDLPPWPVAGAALSLARATAAGRLHTLAVIPAAHLDRIPVEHLANVVPLVTPASMSACLRLLPKVRMVELSGPGDMTALAGAVGAANPHAIIALRMELGPDTVERVSQAAGGRFKVFHLCADLHGCARTADGARGLHLKDTLREIHGRLVQDGRRDEVTLIAGGGIALAEHMAKAIICGADLVAVDTALLVALGCRVCRDAHGNGKSTAAPCPAELGTLDPAYAVERMVNLMGAWHAQLIEVLGAMGIREVRRLRGEVGRAMFLEDIEKEAFRDLVRK